MRLCLILCLTALPLHAEPVLTAEAFDDLTLGRTMTWAEHGKVYGVEQYLANRRVRWTVSGEDCMIGHWYPDGDAICFQYENDPAPDCWLIRESADGLAAEYTSDPPGTAPVVVQETQVPMACFGPEVGV